MHSYQATIVTTFCFFLSTIASPATSRTGPIVQRHGMWNHLGCFVDSAQRILPVQQDTCGKNTVEYCLDLCAQQGFPLAGVEYGDECYCGKDWNTFNTVCPNNCNMTCTANSQEICGGVYAINVYERAQLVEKCGEWTAVGCAEEPKWREGERRNLPYHPGTDIPIKDMTVEKCLDGCAKSGYTCAGLEYGQECWCGNCTANDFKYGSYDKCYMGCTGDPRELCGSGEAEGWEIVYTRNVGTSGGSGSGSSGGGGSGGGSGGGGSEGSGHGTVGSWTPCGCYQKPLLGLLDLLLPLIVELEEALTVEACQAACLAKGYHGCAVDSGDTCRCAGSLDGLLTGLLGLLHLGNGGCNWKCPGNSAETCGGRGALQAYSYRAQ